VVEDGVVGSRNDAALLLDIDGVLIPFGVADAGWMEAGRQIVRKAADIAPAP
jgi:hypothetical protein